MIRKTSVENYSDEIVLDKPVHEYTLLDNAVQKQETINTFSSEVTFKRGNFRDIPLERLIIIYELLI
ncbi:MAG: hypothetical protein ABFC94_12760 [Syntrophomonas sp.]